MKKKIFLDSNIFLAGLASTTGASAEILRLAEAKVFKIYASSLVIKESDRNFRKKLPAFLPFFYSAINYLPLEISHDAKDKNKKLSFLPKESDQIIFATAQSLKIDYFLTLNRKHFHQTKVRKMANFQILTPGQFLKNWRKDLI